MTAMTDVPLISPNALNLHTKLVSFSQAAVCLLAHHLRISTTQAALLSVQTAYIFPMLMERHLLTGSGDKLQAQNLAIEKHLDMHTLPNLLVRHFELNDETLTALQQKTNVPTNKIQAGFDIMAQLCLYVIQTLFAHSNLNRADKLEFFKIQRLFWQDEQILWAAMLKIDSQKPNYQVSDYYKKLGGARKRFDNGQWALPNHAWLFELIDTINQLPPLKIGRAIKQTSLPTNKARHPWLASAIRHKAALIATLIFVGMAVASLALFDKKTPAPTSPTPKAVPQDIAIVRTDDAPSDDKPAQAQNSDSSADDSSADNSKKDNSSKDTSLDISAAKSTKQQKSDDKPSATKPSATKQSSNTKPSKKSEQANQKQASSKNKKDSKNKPVDTLKSTKTQTTKKTAQPKKMAKQPKNPTKNPKRTNRQTDDVGALFLERNT